MHFMPKAVYTTENPWEMNPQEIVSMKLDHKRAILERRHLQEESERFRQNQIIMVDNALKKWKTCYKMMVDQGALGHCGINTTPGFQPKIGCHPTLGHIFKRNTPHDKSRNLVMFSNLILRTSFGEARHSAGFVGLGHYEPFFKLTDDFNLGAYIFYILITPDQEIKMQFNESGRGNAIKTLKISVGAIRAMHQGVYMRPLADLMRVLNEHIQQEGDFQVNPAMLGEMKELNYWLLMQQPLHVSGSTQGDRALLDAAVQFFPDMMLKVWTTVCFVVDIQNEEDLLFIQQLVAIFSHSQDLWYTVEEKGEKVDKLVKVDPLPFKEITQPPGSKTWYASSLWWNSILKFHQERKKQEGIEIPAHVDKLEQMLKPQPRWLGVR
jgi:hypothetical protein